MPRTRSAVNRRTSTAKKVETKPPPKVPKPSREQNAKVVKKPRVQKGKEASSEDTTSVISVGSNVPLTDDFGGVIYLDDGTKTSLKQLVEKSRNGIIVYVSPKTLCHETLELYDEFVDAQLDFEASEMDIIGISRSSISSTAAFVKKHEIFLPLVSNRNGSVMKAMSIISPKGVFVQGAFMLSKTGVLLARAVGNKEKVMDRICRVVFPLIKEMGEKSYD